MEEKITNGIPTLLMQTCRGSAFSRPRPKPTKSRGLVVVVISNFDRDVFHYLWQKYVVVMILKFWPRVIGGTWDTQFPHWITELLLFIYNDFIFLYAVYFTDGVIQLVTYCIHSWSENSLCLWSFREVIQSWMQMSVQSLFDLLPSDLWARVCDCVAFLQES